MDTNRGSNKQVEPHLSLKILLLDMIGQCGGYTFGITNIIDYDCVYFLNNRSLTRHLEIIDQRLAVLRMGTGIKSHL